jgi:hypothetical protein
MKTMFQLTHALALTFPSRLVVRSILSSLLLLLASLTLVLSLPFVTAAQNVATVVRGTVQFEKIPATDTGLQLESPMRRPAAGIKVEIVSQTDNRVFASDFTDEQGHYQFLLPLSDSVLMYVRAVARSENAKVVRVRERNGGTVPAEDSVYSIRTAEFRADPGTSFTQDLLALDSDRSSGPFNILDCIRRANTFVRTAAPNINLPNLTIRWSTGTNLDITHFNSATNEAYIMGDRNDDSDEFDDTVINHEYAHFLAAQFSRSGPGGSHILDRPSNPRLAWSEGWADFFGCASNNTSRYIDTFARGRAPLAIDLEENTRPADRAGYWSEFTVASTLWDLYDSAADEGDTVSLGIAPIWTAFVGLREKTTVYLKDFCDVLLHQKPEISGEVVTILSKRAISYSPGRNHPMPSAQGGKS